MTLTHCCRRSFAHSHVFCAPGRRGDAFVQSWRASVGLRGAGAPYTGMVAGALACVRAALGARRVGWLWRSRWLDRGMHRCFRKSNVLCGCICFRPIRTGGWAKACGFRWCSGFAYFALYFARTQSLRGGSIWGGSIRVDLVVAAGFAGQLCGHGVPKCSCEDPTAQIQPTIISAIARLCKDFRPGGRPAVRKRLSATRGAPGVGPR